MHDIIYTHGQTRTATNNPENEMPQLSKIIEIALSNLTSRQHYAKAVIQGHQRWSGADLKGKARSFGFEYARQRRKASRALRKAGGCIIPVKHGRRVTAVFVGQDDYGNALYQTVDGPAVMHSRTCARLV